MKLSFSILVFFIYALAWGQEELYLYTEEMTAKPLDYKEQFYQKHVMNHQADFDLLREQLEWWDQLDQQMDRAGFDQNGLFDYHQNEDRQRYIQRHFTRFISRRAADSFRDRVDNWRMRSDLDEEIRVRQNIRQGDRIKEKEANKNEEFSLFEGYQFKFRQKLARGFVTAEVANPWTSLTFQLSANGRAEIFFEHSLKKIGLNAFASYRANDGRYLASVSKRIYGDLYLSAIAEANNELIWMEDGSSFSSRKIVSFQYQKSF